MNLAQNFLCKACLAAIAFLTITSPCASADRDYQETYRCTASNGRFDGSVFPSTRNGVIVVGKVSLHTADIGPSWGSSGRIILHERGVHYNDGDCGCNGLTVFAYKNPDHIEFHMTANGEDVPVAQSPYDTPISFRISISPKGVMSVAIGHSDPVIKTVTLRHPQHNTLELTCSGADVSFFEVTMM